MRARCIVALVVSWSVAHTALAHHSVTAWFDTLGMIELEGEVTEFRRQNPHVQFTLRVTDANGEDELWDIETLSISGIKRWGIAEDLFAVGDRLCVAGNRSRRNLNNIFVRNILLPGGREIVLGGAPRWSQEALRAAEVLSAREGEASNPELGLFRTWSSGSGGSFLFPEAIEANFDFSRYPLTATARAALEEFDFYADDPTNDCVDLAPRSPPRALRVPAGRLRAEMGSEPIFGRTAGSAVATRENGL